MSRHNRRSGAPEITRGDFLRGIPRAVGVLGSFVLAIIAASSKSGYSTPSTSIQSSLEPAHQDPNAQPSPETVALTNDLRAKTVELNNVITAIIENDDIAPSGRAGVSIDEGSYGLTGAAKIVPSSSGDPQQPYGGYEVETYSRPQVLVPPIARVCVGEYAGATLDQAYDAARPLQQVIITEEDDGSTSLLVAWRNRSDNPTEVFHTRVNTRYPDQLAIEWSPYGQPDVPGESWTIPLPADFIAYQYQRALDMLHKCSQQPPTSTVADFVPYKLPSAPPPMQ